MIKKIKRYIKNLNYKQTIYFIFIIYLVFELLTVLSISLNLNIFAYCSLEIKFTLLLILPMTIFLILSILFDIPGKKVDEEFEKKRKELEDLLTTSNGKVKLTISNFTPYFPKDIILFYLEKKGTQFYLETAEDDENIYKIYITDKENPNKKIEYPYKITDSVYLKNHFVIKE